MRYLCRSVCFFSILLFTLSTQAMVEEQCPTSTGDPITDLTLEMRQTSVEYFAAMGIDSDDVDTRDLDCWTEEDDGGKINYFGCTASACFGDTCVYVDCGIGNGEGDTHCDIDVD